MKILTHVRLINWHRFIDETIPFARTTFITGMSASGKTTLIDAIQYVLTCDSRNFNSAANVAKAHGKKRSDARERQLVGYVRNKNENDSSIFERSGEVTSHVALEFYEESAKTYFVLGVVIDSPDEEHANPCWYVINNASLESVKFIHDEIPFSIREFRAKNQLENCETTIRNARNMILNRLGRLNSKFFTLIQKAISFEALDFKQFVYDFLLDPKDIDVDSLQRSVRSYQDFNEELKRIRRKIEALESIESLNDRVQDLKQEEQEYIHYSLMAEVEQTEHALSEIERQISKYKFDLDESEKNLRSLQSRLDTLRSSIFELKREMYDQGGEVLEEQKALLKRLQDQKYENDRKLNTLNTSVRAAVKNMNELLRLVPNIDSCIQEFHSLFLETDGISDFAFAIDLTNRVLAYKEAITDPMQKQVYQLTTQKKDLIAKLGRLNTQIEKLEAHIITYPENVHALFSAIKKEFEKKQFQSTPHVLFELLEIEEDQWRDAVEGCLGEKRFYIIVEPETFETAQAVYARLKSKGLSGVGLINTGELDLYTDAPDGSLAVAVSAQTRFSRRYINKVLGRVHKCTRSSELTWYPESVTRNCTLYVDNAVIVIPPDIYKTPYIGQNAFKVQMEQAVAEKNQLEEELRNTDAKLEKYQQIVGLLKFRPESHIPDNLGAIQRNRDLSSEIQSTQEYIELLENDPNILQMQLQLSEMEGRQYDLNKEVASVQTHIGEVRQSVCYSETERDKNMEALAAGRSKVQEHSAEYQNHSDEWEQSYEKKRKDLKPERFHDICRNRASNLDNQMSAAVQKMIDKMQGYKQEFSFGAAANMEAYPEFLKELNRYRSSEVLNYESQAQKAEEMARSELQEQFLARLHEYIETAQDEFQRLNRILKDVPFNHDRYQFVTTPNKNLKNFYDMIMDKNNVPNMPMFREQFYSKWKKEIDDLFAQLKSPNSNAEEILAEYTDYRKYLDYDIRIYNDKGESSRYSKVFREKSGGETQTPFYVAIAASFVELYRSYSNTETPGLIMFDEAFSNMDAQRCKGVLDFLKRLPLQVIIAAPDKSICVLRELTDMTLWVSYNGSCNTVESYYCTADLLKESAV